MKLLTLSMAVSKKEDKPTTQEKDPLKFRGDLVNKMSRLIKYNKNLIHLDLSYTGLDDTAVRALGVALRRAKSIVSMHLSGNPGVKPKVKKYLFKRLQCKTKIDQKEERGNLEKKVNFILDKELSIKELAI